MPRSWLLVCGVWAFAVLLPPTPAGSLAGGLAAAAAVGLAVLLAAALAGIPGAPATGRPRTVAASRPDRHGPPRLLDPDAAGRPRARAPSAYPAAA